VSVCCTPLALTVTGIEYVPAGVVCVVGDEGGVPPPPPPDDEQLETPRVARRQTKTRKERLREAVGNTSSANPTGSAVHGPKAGRLTSAVALFPVVTCRITVPVVPAATVSLVGLKMHAA
jgi:hypothetical protein